MIALSLTMSLAWADAIGPGPPDCPAGSVASASHSGEFCLPGTCAQGCDDGLECQPTGLCLAKVERSCGGRNPEPCSFEQFEVSGACESDADCATGSCEIADRCVPPAALLAPARSFCGCSTAGGAVTAFLIGLLPLAMRRRPQ